MGFAADHLIPTPLSALDDDRDLSARNTAEGGDR